MDTKKLRQKILDLAIRGKLVPQDPNDEPASVLLERIRAEKERLIKEGKIKRSRKSASDTPHYENDVPSNWAVCRLEDIAVIGTGATPDTRIDAYYNGIIPWINSSSTKGEYIEIPSSYISEKAISETNCQIYPSGSLIMARYGEGKTRGQVSELRFDSTTNQACAAIVPIDNQMKGFLKAYLKSNYYHIRTLAEGGNQPNLNLSKISQYIIPIPPIDEQVRIIAAIEKWFALIETLETAKDDLQTSIVQAKSKILDLAIHGKLVPQDPNDEPAIELLKRINPKFTPCDNAQYQYEVPENWAWCKLVDLCSFLSRGKSPKYSEERKYPVFAQKCNLFDGDISLEQARFLDPATLSKWSEEYKLREGDILVNSTGTGTVGRTRLFHSDCLGDYPFVVPDSHVSVIRTVDNIVSNYVYSILSSRYGQEYIEDNLAGSTNQKELYIGVLENLQIPLPPNEEQMRIADKIEELFAVLDEIQKSIEA